MVSAGCWLLLLLVSDGLSPTVCARTVVLVCAVSTVSHTVHLYLSCVIVSVYLYLSM